MRPHFCHLCRADEGHLLSIDPKVDVLEPEVTLSLLLPCRGVHDGREEELVDDGRDHEEYEHSHGPLPARSSIRVVGVISDDEGCQEDVGDHVAVAVAQYGDVSSDPLVAVVQGKSTWKKKKHLKSLQLCKDATKNDVDKACG